jgi:hypothetical protein
MTNAKINKVNIEMSEILQIDRWNDCYCHRIINNTIDKEEFIIKSNVKRNGFNYLTLSTVSDDNHEIAFDDVSKRFQDHNEMGYFSISSSCNSFNFMLQCYSLEQSQKATTTPTFVLRKAVSRAKVDTQRLASGWIAINCFNAVCAVDVVGRFTFNRGVYIAGSAMNINNCIASLSILNFNQATNDSITIEKPSVFVNNQLKITFIEFSGNVWSNNKPCHYTNYQSFLNIYNEARRLVLNKVKE